MRVDKTANIGDLNIASGITREESLMLKQLVSVFEANLLKNEERMAYYEDKKRVSFPGINLRNEMMNIRTDVGWCAKGVDLLAARSVFDGFSVNGEQDDELSKAASDCGFAVEYSRAVPTQLVYGFGLWTLSRGDAAIGEPAVIVRYHSGAECSAIWDYRRNRVKAALVITDYSLSSDGETMKPCGANLYTDAYLVELTYSGTSWSAVRKPNFMGRPMAVPMVYRPNSKPFGKSRISKAAMRITDNMRREIFLANVQSRYYSLPTKYMVNASDELMDSISDKSSIYNDEMLVVGKDSDGETVTIGQLQAASPDNHIAMMDKLAQEIAAEFGLPASTFGADTNRAYVSSDSLRSAQDEVILQAKQLNRDNSLALSQLAQMMLAIIRNETLEKVVADGAEIDVRWVDPAMPSESQIADAVVKEAAVFPWLADAAPDVLLAKMGYDEPTRARIIRQKDDAIAAQSLNAILLGNVRETDDADTENAGR